MCGRYYSLFDKQQDTYLEGFALVPTELIELVAQIHGRLALIVHPRDYDRWLGIGASGDPCLSLDLLHPL